MAVAIDGKGAHLRGKKTMEERIMGAILLEILNLERKNLRTGKKTDKAMVDEIAKIIVDYSQRINKVK